MSFEQARRDVVSTCLVLADRGFLAGTGGNVAYRIDEEHFAVTPSAIDYYAMRQEDICVLRFADLACVAGKRAPSMERVLHANVLRARPDCRASVHTHQPIASAYSLLGCSLEIARPEDRETLGPWVASVGYAPSGTRWLASKLKKAIRADINAYLIRNHGVVCCGPTLEETVRRVEVLEAVCAAFFHDRIKARLGTESGAPILRLLLPALCLRNEELVL
jgi:L-fuculose-phosphate aldolase